jgi:DNA-binding NarL/FixJ family response regulator
MRVVVADASPFVRMGICAALRAQDLDVVAEVGTADAARIATLRHAPDAVLIDWALDPTATAIADMCAVGHVAVVVTATDATDGDILRAVRAGAAGVLPADTPLDRLAAIVRGAIAGEAVLSRTQVRRLLGQLVDRPAAHASVFAGTALTSREREILDRMERGETYDRIAAVLNLSPVTVRRHASSGRHKLAAQRRASRPAVA